MNFRLPTALAVVATCVAPFCSPVATAEPVTLGPLTVTATRYERPLSATPASVTVLEEEDIAPFASQPVEDILSVLGGVTLARTGGPGQQVSVFLRGSNSNSTLVLVDGVKINGGTFGGASLQHLRGADITRIEVIRGPRSTLHGSEAIGGVIAITTRRGADTEKIALHAGSGDDNSADFRVRAANGGSTGHIAAGIGYTTTDGDPVTDRTTISGEHSNHSGTLNASTRTGDSRIGIDIWAARGMTRYVDCVYDAAFACVGTTPLEQAFYNVTASAWSEHTLGDSTTLRTRLAHAGDQIEQRQSTDQARTRRLLAGLEFRQLAGHHTLVGGIEAEREDVAARIYGADLATQTDNHAVFVRDDWAHGRHLLSAGVRHARYENFGTHGTGEASYALHLTPDTLAWLAWGRGFRAPDASERFAFGGNPALDPERSDSKEAGLRQQLGAHEISITGFVQHIDDLIDYPAPAFTATNIARARITGTEFGWRWRTGHTRLEAFVTLQDPVDNNTGARLARRPAQQLSATARQRTGSIEWRAAVRAMDQRDNSAFDNVTLPGYAVLDLGMAWTPAPAWNIDLRVDNVGDHGYALASGAAGDYLMPDRAFFLGIDWHH